ncbi:MAG: hypothetical protein AAB909_03860, partial [Patescibacteria group bacterium]
MPRLVYHVLRIKYYVLFFLAFCMLGVGGVWAEECDDPSKLSDSGVISGCISKYAGILDAISKANST